MNFKVVEVVRSTTDGKFRSLGMPSRRGIFVACIYDINDGWCFGRLIHVKTGLAPELPRDYGTDVARIKRLMSKLEALPGMDKGAKSIANNKELRLATAAILKAFK